MTPQIQPEKDDYIVDNKGSAVAFLKMVVAKNIREAYDKFIAPDFIHHNQYFKSDRESLLVAMEQAHRKFPDTTIEIKRIYEDNDTVITHSLVKHGPNEADIAVVHIFRFKNGLVAELWDLGMQIQEDSPNDNGLF